MLIIGTRRIFGCRARSDIGSRSPHAVRLSKHLLRNAEATSLQTALDMGALARAVFTGSHDQLKQWLQPSNGVIRSLKRARHTAGRGRVISIFSHQRQLAVFPVPPKLSQHDWSKPAKSFVPGLREQDFSRVRLSGQIEQSFAGMDSIGAAGRDRPRQRHGAGVGIDMNMGDDADGQRVVATHLATGVGQFARHVVANETAQQGDPRNIGREAPAHFHHRKLSIGRGNADVGTEHDLEARTEREAVNCGDHGNRQCPPAPCGLLKDIGLAMAAGHQVAERRIAGKAVKIDTGTKPPGPPDSTTQRTAFFLANRSIMALIASNCS